MKFGSSPYFSIRIALFILGCVVSSANPITFDVNCGGRKVGGVSIDATGTGISGGFTSSIAGPPVTLAAAAAQCGEDHFDWYQIVVSTTAMGLKDNAGRPFSAPFVDPPAGGFGGQWADNLPWYFDEYRPPAGTPFQADLQLTTNTTVDTLKYFDYPGGPPRDEELVHDVAGQLKC